MVFNDRRATVRLATYNSLDHTDGYDYATRLMQAMQQFKALECDAVALQEIPKDKAGACVDALDAMGYTLIVQNHDALDRTHVTGLAYRNDSVQSVDGQQDMLVPALETLGYPASTIPVTDAVLTHLESGQPFHVLSYHGHWGATRQHERLVAASRVNHALHELHPVSQADNVPDMPVVWMGDFNAVHEEHAMQYLLGYLPDDDGAYTYWTPADPAFTATTNVIGAAARTAMNHGIDPAVMRARGIDYILSMGFVNGKRGGTVNHHLLCMPESSDHMAVVADMRI